MGISKDSVLFITTDSCRYDTFIGSHLPNILSVGPVHKAYAPSHFTYGSHAAMFMGFTPGVPSKSEPLINPKFGKLFKLVGTGFPGKGTEGVQLTGRNVVDAFNRQGYLTLGTGAVGWFNPNTETGKTLSADFQRFYYPGGPYYLDRQVEWILDQISTSVDRNMFVFINIGETHVPYYYQGADWDRTHNPCIPFGTQNDRNICAMRQRKCIEFVDETIKELLDMFSKASTVICSDHGDCWGEDGLWEHGVHHEATLTVPLVIRWRGVAVR